MRCRAWLGRALLLMLALTGCHSASPPAQGPVSAVPNVARWPMYQYSGDHNAVFARGNFRTRWKFDSKAKINGGLAIADNTLFVDTFGKEVVALDLRTGKVLWRRGGLKNIVMSTPVVAGGLVYVGTGGNNSLHFGWNRLFERIQYHNKAVWGVPGGDEVVALDVRDGRPRWRYQTLGEDMPSPVYYNGVLYFANGDWHAYALRADTGQEVWRRSINGVSTMASAAVADGRVIVAACADATRASSTIALDPRTGDTIWEAPYGHCDGAPTFAEHKVFVESVQSDARKYIQRTVVAALDARTGKPVWTHRSSSPGVWTMVGSHEAAIAGTYDHGTYYQPSPLDDQIIAFNARNGAIRWVFHTQGPVKMSPVVKNGHLYVGDSGGVFYDLSTADGSIVRATPFTKPFATSPPVILGKTIFFVNDETVYATEMSS